MSDATIEFLQFLVVLFLLPYVLGGAICLAAFPFVAVWLWVKRRWNEPYVGEHPYC